MQLARQSFDLQVSTANAVTSVAAHGVKDWWDVLPTGLQLDPLAGRHVSQHCSVHLLRLGQLAARHQAQHQLPPVAVRLFHHYPAGRAGQIACVHEVSSLAGQWCIAAFSSHGCTGLALLSSCSCAARKSSWAVHRDLRCSAPAAAQPEKPAGWPPAVPCDSGQLAPDGTLVEDSVVRAAVLATHRLQGR